MRLAAWYDALVPLPVFQALKAFCLAAMAFSTCSFHHQVHDANSGAQLYHTPPQLSWASSLDVVPDILSGSISYTCRCTHMGFENLEMIAHRRVFKLPNFKGRDELALGFWWHINPHVAYKKLMLQGYFLARDHFYICDKFAHGPMEKDEVYLHGYFPNLWWDGCHVSWNMFPRSRLNARAYSRVLSPSVFGSSLPYPIPPCTSLYPEPAWPTWLFQSPHWDQKFGSWDPVSVTAHSWSKNRSLTSSLRPLCGYTQTER